MATAISGIGKPDVDATAPLPKRERVSATELAKYFREQYENGLQLRRERARAWAQVRFIMRGIHHFRTMGGVLRALRPDVRKVRPRIPVMKPKFKIELGRLNSNIIGVSSLPITSNDPEAFYRADRAAAITEDWIEEVDAQGVHDKGNEHLLYYGGTWQYVAVDRFKQRVVFDTLPDPEMFPIPFEAKELAHADGVMRVQLVSKQWLEQQDDMELRRRKSLAEKSQANPAEVSRFRRMAEMSSKQSLSLSDTFAGMASHGQFHGNMEGAVSLTIWMKPSESDPAGQYYFMVEDKIFRALTGFEQKRQPDGSAKTISKALPPGGQPPWDGVRSLMPILPLEPIHYVKQPDSWWGYGFLEDLVPLQREMNRQMASVIRSANHNKPVTVYDSSMISGDDIQDADAMLIAARGVYDGGKLPLMHWPAPGVGRDVGAVLGVVREAVDIAANHESGILVGRQEGRTEGGPATNVLNLNAQVPLQTVVDRTYRAFKRTFNKALDMQSLIWPEDSPKIVRTQGKLNLGRELRIKASELPWSHQVRLTPTPMIANGRQAMLQMLFHMRTLPSDSGQGFEIKSRELRRALRMMNMNPPGLEMVDKVEQRIRDRIALLIGDGQKPAIPSSASGAFPEMVAEDHVMAIDILKEIVLDIGSFSAYGPSVQQALRSEMNYHMQFGLRQFAHPNNFETDDVEQDQLRSEADLDAAEQDLSSFDGQMRSPDGIPVGLEI